MSELDVARLARAMRAVWGVPTDTDALSADARDIAAEYGRLAGHDHQWRTHTTGQSCDVCGIEWTDAE